MVLHMNVWNRAVDIAENESFRAWIEDRDAEQVDWDVTVVLTRFLLKLNSGC